MKTEVSKSCKEQKRGKKGGLGYPPGMEQNSADNGGYGYSLVNMVRENVANGHPCNEADDEGRHRPIVGLRPQ